MSINGIGKGGGLPPVAGSSETSATGPTQSVSTEFKVARAEVGRVGAAAPLDQLRAGQLTLPQYLDIKVIEATVHLDGKLSADQLAFVKNSLREQLSNDPALVDLVKAATGSLPPPTE